MARKKAMVKFSYLQKKVPMYSVIGDLLELERDVEELTTKPIADAHLVENNHKTIQEYCFRMLELEGFDPVYKEVTLHGFPIKYRADVVGYKDGKIHTVIEIGTLTDPAKMQLFAQTFPRFIWIPFVPILDIEALQKTCAIIEKWPEVVSKLNKDFGDIREKILGKMKLAIDDSAKTMGYYNSQWYALIDERDRLQKDLEILKDQVEALGVPSNYERRETQE